MSWVYYAVAAGMAAAVAIGGVLFYLRSRKRRAAGTPQAGVPPVPPAGAATTGTAAMPAMPGPGAPPAATARAGQPAATAKRRGRIPPRIVSATGPPPPRPRPLEPEERPELPGAGAPQPRVTKEANEEEMESGELEDMAREAIESTRMMVSSLMETGKDVSAALRQLGMAAECLEKGKPEEALNYAGKAMDVAESLEAEQERCPRCHAETKPRWMLCPKCGWPLKEQGTGTRKD